MRDFEYSGAELDLFSHARNWKAYWATVVRPYLGATVLDVGAGVGATAENLKSGTYRRWVELEPDARQADRIRISIREGRLPPTIEVRTGSTRTLGPEDRFDTILYIDVLEHIEKDALELAQVSAHLLPGGHIVVLAPAHNWLYTPFDRQLGHFRRYNKATLLATKPPTLSLVRLQYIDSVGMLASLGNKLLLRATVPTLPQIRLWDNFMIPASRGLDKLFAGTLGKSIVAVFRR